MLTPSKSQPAITPNGQGAPQAGISPNNPTGIQPAPAAPGEPAQAPPPAPETPAPTRVTSVEDIAGRARELFAKTRADAQPAKPPGDAPPPSTSTEAPASKASGTSQAAEGGGAPPVRSEPEVKDPALLSAIEKLTQGQQQIEADREAVKAEQEKHAEALKRLESLDSLKDTLENGGVAGLKKVLEVLGATNADTRLRELHDEMALQELGLEPDSGQKALSESRRLRDELNRQKTEQAEAESKRQEAAQQQEKQRQVQEELNVLGRDFTAHAASYPHLQRLVPDASQPAADRAWATPEQIIWSQMDAHFKKTGQVLSFEDAAKEAEAHVVRLISPFSDLHAPKSDEGTPKGTAPASDGPRTLTSQEASAPTGATPQFGKFIADPEQSKQVSIDYFKSEMARRRAEESAR